MLQPSKIIRSRDGWREKAIQRAYELREFRKTHKRQREKIAELKAEISTIEQGQKNISHR